MRKSKSGFTIVELIVVIVVIAILAAIVITAYNGAQARARDSQRRTDVANLAKAMELYYSDNGSYPLAGGSSGSIINGNWFTSSDSSWNLLNTALVGSKAIDKTPVDPKNTTTIASLYNGGYNYAIYVNSSSYCGAAPGQMFIIIYRLENFPKEKFSDGPCTTNPLGDTYYTSNGASYYRNVKGGS